MPMGIGRKALTAAAGAGLLVSAGVVVAEETAPAPADQVTIENFTYGPGKLTIAAGTKVTWVNRDEEPHTVNSNNKGAAFKSGALDTGDRFAFVFGRPGTYAYFCSIHPYMSGTIVVK